MFSQGTTADSRSARMQFPSSFDTYLEICLNDTFKKQISRRKAIWMPSTQWLTHQTETSKTQLKLCDIISVGPHPAAAWSLTFSPSTTSNSTVSPSPTLRRYFRGLFFFIAVLKGKCIKIYYFMLLMLHILSPTDKGRAVFLCYKSNSTHQSSHCTKVFQTDWCLLFHRPTNTQFKVSSSLTSYKFINHLLLQDLLCPAHWTWKLLQISAWTEFILSAWFPPSCTKAALAASVIPAFSH